jgi:hypothetical protein
MHLERRGSRVGDTGSGAKVEGTGSGAGIEDTGSGAEAEDTGSEAGGGGFGAGDEGPRPLGGFPCLGASKTSF